MNTSFLAATTTMQSAISNPTEAGASRFLRRLLPPFLAGVLALGLLAAFAGKNTNAFPADERKIVAALDTQYQAAVQNNDAVVMDHLLADDFALVTGSGKTYTKADLLAEARGGRTLYERQSDSAQTVRIWGDTAVITAKLWAKGMENGKPFEYTVWFSDTYVRIPTGWRYVFGQSSLPLPKTP